MVGGQRFAGYKTRSSATAEKQRVSYTSFSARSLIAHSTSLNTASVVQLI